MLHLVSVTSFQLLFVNLISVSLISDSLLTVTSSFSVDSPFSLSTTPSLFHYHNRFTALFPGPPGSAGARRELLDFTVQGKVKRGRYTDHPTGRHYIRTNQCQPPPSPYISYRLDALPAAQPTVSKH